MSHNFTQLEEIDRILMTMAVYDPEADMPDPDGKQSSLTIREAQSEESVTGPSCPYVI